MDNIPKVAKWLLIVQLLCRAATDQQCEVDNPKCVNNICSSYGDCFQGCKPEYQECRVVSTVDESCGFSDCKCCATNSCSTKGFCTSGCRPGNHGGRCRNECPDNCITCIDHPDAGSDRPDLSAIGYCTACKEGHYFTHDLYQCQSTCSSGCRTCLSASKCTSCQTGYFPDFQSPGSCIVCPNECDSSCEEHKGCLYCIPGYYHVLNQEQGELGRCMKCPNNCTTCESDAKCTLCKNGFYGTRCELKCSNGCATQCLKDNGTCQCKGNFVGDKCNSCVTGLFGNDCAETCPQNCQNNKCDRLSGDCNFCIGNHALPKCETCINGFQGPDCKTRCPKNCLNSTCDQLAGVCTSGCEGHFNGEKCEECIVGRFGHQCTKTCPKMCFNNMCHRTTGYCLKCSLNFTGNTCENCKNGLYGLDCNLSCPPNCNDSICYKQNGTCVNGCDHNFSGDLCCLNNSFCDTCSSIHECEHCINGKYGQVCDSNCTFDCETCDRYNGSCLGCKNGIKGPNCVKQISQANTQKETDIAGPVAGTVSGVVVISMVVLVIVFFHRRRFSGKKKNNPRFDTRERIYENEDLAANSPRQTTEANTKQDLKSEEPPLPLKEIKPLTSERQEQDEYYNTMNTEIKVKILADHVKGRDSQSFIKEFQNLPKGLQKPCIDAKRPENLAKNRYNAIFPYDDNRVKLVRPGSDFINACYINGYKKKKEYIASLGPIKKATEDFKTFWRMVWQEKTEKIVMVTNLMEKSGMKCEKYWPDVSSTNAYGDVIVTCQSEEIFAEYTLRKLTVYKGDESRPLHQVHYTAWPDKAVPVDITSLIDFRQKVNMIKSTSRGPIIVHCSAGVGRTGTYIALDILTQEGETEGTVNVFNCVSRLRHQRTSMVQTWEQYEYLHHALVHTLTFDYRPIAAEEFEEFVSTSSDAVMAAKFERLQSAKENVPESEVKAKQRNRLLKDLNRENADIPGDTGRTRLYEDRTEGDNDYINAVYLNSYRQKNRYILAMTPLPETVTDFLTLLIQERVSCIVSLDDEHSQSQSTGTYIPADNQTMKIGALQVKSRRIASNSSYIQRALTCVMHTRSGPKSQLIHHFQINHWPGGSAVPHDDAKFLKLILDAEKATDDATERATMVVHCLNAAERSGLFCALSIMIQKMQTDHEVSVINTLRQVKVRRSLAIPNKEQYIFCHKCICTHLQSEDSNVYTNLAMIH